MPNTGKQGWTRLLKVVNGGPNDGQPLDANNNLCSMTGLPQAMKNNVSSDPNYVPPANNPTACPIESGGTGTCYSVLIPNSKLNDGMGNDLYITIKRPNASIGSQPYYAYLSVLDPTPEHSGFMMCSEQLPSFKYGFAGHHFYDPDFVINPGNNCDNDSQCNF